MIEKLTDKKLFERLKELTKDTFLQNNSASSKDISQWKGQDIVNFQEDLRLKVKGQVSEKWFYMHMKTDSEKLPRIDMLNLLARYCGYYNWADFVSKNEQIKQNGVKEKRDLLAVDNGRNRNMWIKLGIPIFLLSIILALFLYIYWNSDYYRAQSKGPIYEFCFLNADRNKAINDLVEITIRAKGLPPHYRNTTSGCYSFHSKLDTVQMIVNSTYYKKDTFDLILSHYNEPQTIELYPDDYKLVWRYYLQSNIGTRRDKLKNSIHPNAQIYRVYEENQRFIEPYSREEYIDFLSSPTTSLENFEMIQSDKKNNKFIYIKFKIAEPDEQ